MVSVATGIPIRRDVTMTGELTLRGRVLPIGGLKEKLLAAVRAGMRAVIVPAGNVAELAEVPEHLRSKIKIHPVHTMSEVLAVALSRPLAQPKRSGSSSVRPSGGAKPVAPSRRGGVK